MPILLTKMAPSQVPGKHYMPNKCLQNKVSKINMEVGLNNSNFY